MAGREDLFWIWLAEGLGPENKDFSNLIHLYESPYSIFEMDEAEAERISEISPKTRKAILDKDLQHAGEVLDLCERMGIGVLPFGSQDYPNELRNLIAPPIVLYYKGKLPNFNRDLFIGMVGTRNMSAYGLYSGYKIAYELTSAGVHVVSGMAAGIDGVCAAGAIAAKGHTVAVLGCGVNMLYPKHHGTLKRAIEQYGVILSEYPPNTSPTAYHFPQRNRIISGLSQGTVVVEAGVGSGSLITAKDAILQGRDVFALPANMGSVGAEGTNGLLKEGASLVTGTEDILEPYQVLYSEYLHPEALPKAKTKSRADLEYLERMGVIQLTKRESPARNPLPIQAAKQEEPPKKAKTVRKKKEKPTESEQATDIEQLSIGGIPESPQAEQDLSMLSSVQRAVYEAIPKGKAVSTDAFSNLGFPYGDTVAALTILEMFGLIEKKPGSMYIKV